MATPADDDRVLAFRIGQLERQVETGFKDVQKTILDTSLTFVRLDLYLSERDGMRADMDAIRKLAMWAVGLVCSTALGAVILGIVAMSGAFK